MGREGKKEIKREKKKGRRGAGREIEKGGREGRINQQPTNQPTVVTWQSGFSQIQKMILLKELHKTALQAEVNNERVKVKVSL